MRKALRKLIPTPILERLDIFLERRRLAKVETLPAQVDRLRRIDRGELEQILASPELAQEWQEVQQETKALTLPDRTMGVSPGDRRLLYYLVRTFQPRKVLEVGSHIGASTLHIALAQRRGSSPEEELALTSVDIVDVNDPVTKPWLRHGASHSPRELIATAGAGGWVTFVHQGSLEFLAGCGEEFDFVFLDGDHRAATVYREIPQVLARLRAGGVILLHDFYPQHKVLIPGDDLIVGPCLAVERLASEHGLEVLPLGKLPWATTLGSQFTNMALLTRSEGAPSGGKS